MPIEATTQTVNGNVYTLSGNDDLNVAAGVTITSFGTLTEAFDAVTTFSGQHTITVSGTIDGDDDGINTIGCELAQTIEIFAGGKIISGADGEIEDSDGVILAGVNSTLRNAGTILSHGSGVQVFVNEGGTTSITNSGLITAGKYGIWNKFSFGTLEFTNTGTIESGLGSYLGGSNVDIVTNSGRMEGNVTLGGDDDVYIGTGGIVIGRVFGGSGADRFVAGSGVDKFDGGEGVDLLDFSGSSQRVLVDLTDAEMNLLGSAQGDVYVGIENVSGTAHHDTLTGNASGNHLFGNGGRDRLNGGAGMDTLEGGIGGDTLTGGSESDVFVYNSSKDGGDVITDFVASFDLLRINGSAFGLGTATGTLAESAFVIATNNVALDADDRFIFNTTDATLWYDRDGSGSRAAIRMVDFTDGTMLNFWDINVV